MDNPRQPTSQWLRRFPREWVAPQRSPADASCVAVVRGSPEPADEVVVPQHASAATGEMELPFAVSLSSYALRGALFVALALVCALSLALVSPAPAAQAAGSEAGMVIYDAKNQLGKPWVSGATGMRSYDCSGLVFRMYEMNGLLDRIGGSRRTVRGFFNWFRDRGLVSRSNPRVGDLIVWGDNKHIGIYVGDGKAISTLVSGVKRHGVFGLTIRFKAYLHVRLDR